MFGNYLNNHFIYMVVNNCSDITNNTDFRSFIYQARYGFAILYILSCSCTVLVL